MQNIGCYQADVKSFDFSGWCVSEPYQPYDSGLRGLHTVGGKKRYYLSDPFAGVYLTEQEARCLLHFAQGLTYRQIASLLDCAETTVGSYFAGVTRKLHCVNQKQLQHVMAMEGLLSYLWKADPTLWQS